MYFSFIFAFGLFTGYTLAAPLDLLALERARGDETFSADQDASQPSEQGQNGEKEPLSPSQQGRLARFNGDFFQLYGATNQIEGNLDGIAGNQLAFRGNVIEFLGNEHGLRELDAYLEDIEEERTAEAAKATGREKELQDEEVQIIGSIRHIVEMSAGKEHEQAQQKVKQFNLEARSYKLEKEHAQYKAEQTVAALELGNLEEEQIKLENKARKYLARLEAIEEERSKGTDTVAAPGPVAPPAPPSTTNEV